MLHSPVNAKKEFLLLKSHKFFPLFRYYGHGGNEFDSLILKPVLLRSVKSLY